MTAGRRSRTPSSPSASTRWPALGTTRRLVLLPGAQRRRDAGGLPRGTRNGRHPSSSPATGPDRLDDVIDGVRPRRRRLVRCARTMLVERHDGSAHQLHPDLALLLTRPGRPARPSSSGSRTTTCGPTPPPSPTTSTSTPDDRAITTLPLHYCYGLSVAEQPPARAAPASSLTDLSVSTRASGSSRSRAGVTSFAGVPYTFDLLDRVGFADRDLPSLRYVTQAGGRLDPRPGRGATPGSAASAAGTSSSMYGQTEATARMAYLPPDLAASRIRTPSACRSPAASFRIDPDRRHGRARASASWSTRGANVMMGYAAGPADLALRPRRSTSCAPVTWPGGRRRAATRWSAAAAGSPRCSGCGSTWRPRGGALDAAGAARCVDRRATARVRRRGARHARVVTCDPRWCGACCHERPARTRRRGDASSASSRARRTGKTDYRASSDEAGRPLPTPSTAEPATTGQHVRALLRVAARPAGRTADGQLHGPGR